ncbi:MAG TPA: peptidyl-prolyl cis-trans isomerase [Tepidisphaeraceae bacterium]|nr:peptidyl-prolyl cis-trans isomerase [Tepidisphaeraceae bacterium]
MKPVVGVVLTAIITTAGCSSQQQSDGIHEQNLSASPMGTNGGASAAVNPPPALADQQVLARIAGQPVMMREVTQPLLESRGLALLLNIAQLDVAKEDARKALVTVTSEDMSREMDLTLDRMFHDADQKEQDQLADAELKHQTDKASKLRATIRDDRNKLLDQYLENQHYSRGEFQIVVELNAYLRKAAETQLQGKITDDMVQKEFGLEYGETARCRVIQLPNMQEVNKAQQALKAGRDFADIAREMSINSRTAPLGGEMPPFSLQAPGYPTEFKQLAFSLQPGQVSDPLILGSDFYLIKLEARIPPKAVKFADVKDSLRQSMYEKLTEDVMKTLRQNLATQVMTEMTIDDPMLSKQFVDLKARQEGAIKERQKLNEQWKKERAAGTQPAATQPAATSPAGQ